MNYRQSKNKTLICFIVFAFILLVAFGYYVFIGRYYISEPMMDLEYKKAIIKESKNVFYRLENLRPVVGEEELIEFIRVNNDNPEIYHPSGKNLEEGIFKANLHMHTLQSDGVVPVEKRLDDAQKYAEKYLKGGCMYIAITDHNTVLGAKDVVKVLQRYPGKYKNVKVVLGMEVYTGFRSKYKETPVETHVLCWCINPYDKFLNKEFFKPKNANKWNRIKPDRDFDDLILMMSKYSIPGIAHPIRYTNNLRENKELYMEEMMSRYGELSKKTLFAEGHYQVYSRYYDPYVMKHEILPYMDFVKKKADEHNIIKTGSTDSHSGYIFK